jgi:hypothetical protein
MSISLFWNWDTCAPSPYRAPLCGWSATPSPAQGIHITYINYSVFPKGFISFELRRSFQGTPSYQAFDLLRGADPIAVHFTLELNLIRHWYKDQLLLVDIQSVDLIRTKATTTRYL